MISEHLQKWKDWWAPLAEREKRMVSVGSAFVVLALLYVLIWSPYLTHVDNLRKQVQVDQKTLRWMQVADNEIRQLASENTPKVAVLSPVELLSYLQQQLAVAGLGVSQLKQVSTDSVQMQFQKVDFDRLIGFLIKVSKEQSISITQMSVIADPTPGIVNADIILKLS